MSRAGWASVAAGVVGGATLFAMIGSITDRAVLGGISGAAIGAVVGWGWRRGLVSSAVVWMCCFAVAGAFIGPGCDADALSSALSFGAFGAFIGYVPWRGLVALVCLLFALAIHPLLFFIVLFVLAVFFTPWFYDGNEHSEKKSTL